MDRTTPASFQGVFHNGVVVPVGSVQIPEGTAIKFEPAATGESPTMSEPSSSSVDGSPSPPSLTLGEYLQSLTQGSPPDAEARVETFGEKYAQFIVDADGLPDDLAAQHDHYRLGKPKR